MKADQVLFEIGSHMMKPLIDKGYESVLQSLGDSLFQLLANVDVMHTNISKIYPSMCAISPLPLIPCQVMPCRALLLPPLG